jgi:hypothetical protein
VEDDSAAVVDDLEAVGGVMDADFQTRMASFPFCAVVLQEPETVFKKRKEDGNEKIFALLCDAFHLPTAANDEALYYMSK